MVKNVEINLRGYKMKGGGLRLLLIFKRNAII